MKNVKNLIPAFLFALMIGLFSCQKKSSTINNTGIQFFASKNSALGFGHFTGTSLNKTTGILNVPIGLVEFNDNYGGDVGSLNFDFSVNKIYEQYCTKADTTKFVTLVNTKDGHYIGVANDWVKRKANIPFQKLVWMDQNFNILKQYSFTDTLNIGAEITPLENGTYVLFSGLRLTCFDPDLNIIWVKNFSYQGLNILTGPNSIIFENHKTFTDKYKLIKYDYSFLNPTNTYISPSGHLSISDIYEITAVSNGFIVMGEYMRPDKGRSIFIDHFDWNLKLIESNLLDLSNYKNPNDEISLKGTNVIEVDGAYYFIIGAVGYTPAWNLYKSLLIKLNGRFEIEWVKNLHDRNSYWTGSYLAAYNNKLLCIGQSTWLGVNGFTFIRTDLDGNIIK